MKNAVGYCRVSTERQSDDDKYGLEAQKKDILDYCVKNDYCITRWFVDGGVSGVKEERPELDKILFEDEVDNPPIETVIVAKSDRLARDINLYFYYTFVLKKKNIELISVAEDFGAMGPFSGVIQAFTLFVAEQERANIAKRTTAGRRIKAKAGGYSGGRAPYGYKISNGQLIIDESESELVKVIFQMKDNGETLQDIADYLSDKGFRTRSNKRFYPSLIRSITDNRKTYQGYYKYGPAMNWVKGQHEPILLESDK